MTSPLSRRSLVAAAPAAIIAAALPALAVNAETGDTHLLDLGRQWTQANALAAEADRQLSAVSKIYDRAWPDVEPEALFVRPGDDLALKTWPEKVRGKPTGRHIYGPTDIETAEVALRVVGEDKLPGSDDPKWPAKVARLREIVDCHVARREGRRAAGHSCGMEQAEAASTDAHDRCKELLLEIAQCPATTLAGVQLKVRASMHCFGDTLDEAEAQIDGMVEELSTGEALALSILKDMARMAELNALGGAHA